jgi:hypothetical protein
MTKKELRSSISSDLSSFFAAGGSVIVVETKISRRKNSASGKQKLRLGWSEPKNRPSNSWDLVELG